jgi:hypothetical protein
MYLGHLFPLLLGSVNLQPTDPHIVWSPGNVCVDSGAVTVTQNSAYFKAGFTGTSFGLNIDVSIYHRNSIAAWHWGQWVVSVDGAAPVPVQVLELPVEAT